MQDPTPPAGAPTPGHRSRAQALRLRASAGAGALAVLVLAACAGNTPVTQSAAEGPKGSRRVVTEEEAINADPAFLGKIVGNMAPQTTVTTTAPGPGDPDVTEPGATNSTTATTPTTPRTAPPVVTTQPPPVQSTTTVTFSTPPINPGRTQPTPYAGALSADETVLLNKIKEATGIGNLQLENNLMTAARAGQQAPPAGSAGFTRYNSGNLYGNGSAANIVNNADPSNLPPGGVGFTHVGVGSKFDGTFTQLYYIIAVF